MKQIEISALFGPHPIYEDHSSAIWANGKSIIEV
jgi:hypothetical protein